MTNEQTGIQSWSDVRDQLDKFRTLKPNWDSYKAKAIDEDAIDRARKLVGWLRTSYPQPTIVSPTNAGGVNFEWHNHNGVDRELEVTITPDGRMEIFYDACSDDAEVIKQVIVRMFQ